jgi:hypothetical protein
MTYTSTSTDVCGGLNWEGRREAMWVKTGAVVGLLSVLAGCSTDNLEDTAYTSEAVQEQTDSLGRTLSAAAARVAMENTSAARDLHLLARLEVRPGELLEFYEPSEDVLMISGAGALDDMLRARETSNRSTLLKTGRLGIDTIAAA